MFKINQYRYFKCKGPMKVSEAPKTIPEFTHAFPNKTGLYF